MRKAKTLEEATCIADEAVKEIEKSDDDYSEGEVNTLLILHKSHPSNTNQQLHTGLLEIARHGVKETGFFGAEGKKRERILAREAELKERGVVPRFLMQDPNKGLEPGYLKS